MIQFGNKGPGRHAILLAIACFFISAFMMPAWAQPQIIMQSDDSKYAGEFIVPINKSQVLRLDVPVADLLVGNSEIAGGMFLLKECGSDYIVVCKEMKYRFLRPCFGPAVYDIVDSEDLESKLSGGDEFNIDLDIEIRQRLKKKGRDLRVGQGKRLLAPLSHEKRCHRRCRRA